MKVDEGDRTRPFAYADPRSLSQAWYDALYGSRAPHRDAPPSASPLPQRAAEPEREPAAEFQAQLTQVRAGVPPLLQQKRAMSDAAPGGPKEALATIVRHRIKRARSEAPAQSENAGRSDVEIDDGHGGLRLLVSQRGGELEVVAICEREARERTADALARARIALGARGIALNTTIREKHEGEAP